MSRVQSYSSTEIEDITNRKATISSVSITKKSATDASFAKVSGCLKANYNRQKKIAIRQIQENGAADGARTRDPRRDRPVL